MTKNEGTMDRAIRGVLGLILVLLPFLGSAALFANPVFYWGSLIIGAVLLFTAVTGFCAVYTLFGIRTCKR